MHWQHWEFLLGSAFNKPVLLHWYLYNKTTSNGFNGFFTWILRLSKNIVWDLVGRVIRTQFRELSGWCRSYSDIKFFRWDVCSDNICLRQIHNYEKCCWFLLIFRPNGNIYLSTICHYIFMAVDCYRKVHWWVDDSICNATYFSSTEPTIITVMYNSSRFRRSIGSGQVTVMLSGLQTLMSLRSPSGQSFFSLRTTIRLSRNFEEKSFSSKHIPGNLRLTLISIPVKGRFSENKHKSYTIIADMQMKNKLVLYAEWFIELQILMICC